jgi:hypothetical protein
LRRPAREHFTPLESSEPPKTAARSHPMKLHCPRDSNRGRVPIHELIYITPSPLVCQRIELSALRSGTPCCGMVSGPCRSSDRRSPLLRIIFVILTLFPEARCADNGMPRGLSKPVRGECTANGRGDLRSVEIGEVWKPRHNRSGFDVSESGGMASRDRARGSRSPRKRTHLLRLPGRRIAPGALNPTTSTFPATSTTLLRG